MGRQPGFMPPIEGQSRLDSVDGRQEQRVRELAINSMVQASAQAQIYRARKGRGTNHPEMLLTTIAHLLVRMTKDGTALCPSQTLVSQEELSLAASMGRTDPVA